MTSLLLVLAVCGVKSAHYCDGCVPQLFQVDPAVSASGWAHVSQTFGAQPPLGLGKLSNPNWHPRWNSPDGTHGMNLRDVKVSRTISVPDNTWILVWRQPERYPGNQFMVWRWKFPIGTEVKEELTYQNKLWLTRTRTRELEQWSEDVQEHLKTTPPGYKPSPLSCVQCHKDAGQHVSRLPDHARMAKHYPGETHSWYHFMRGGGDPRVGGVFSFRPVNPRGQIPVQFRHIVKFGRP